MDLILNETLTVISADVIITVEYKSYLIELMKLSLSAFYTGNGN
jgi:hypothetical protein